MEKKCIIFKCLICLFYFDVYSTEDMQKNILNEIFLHAEQSIDRIEDGKIFFKPEKVFLFQDQLFVETDMGNGVLLPEIDLNNSELFLAINFHKNQEPIKQWECLYCFTKYEEENFTGECQVCHERDFKFLGFIFKQKDGSLLRLDKLPDPNQEEEE